MADRGSSMAFADDVVEKVGRLAGVLDVGLLFGDYIQFSLNSLWKWFIFAPA